MQTIHNTAVFISTATGRVIIVDVGVVALDTIAMIYRTSARLILTLPPRSVCIIERLNPQP